MSKTKILVVEDENIVAKDIQNTLIRLGYDVPATASSAVIAFDKLDEVKPDLVFLDIRLKGDMDGIQIAERIKTEYDLPVIFLTSYADKNTLDRAKLTQPYGYLIKPFNESDLQSTVEMALYNFKQVQQLMANKNLYANALSHLDEAILITDNESKISFLNPKAVSITGFGSDSAKGKEISSLIRFENNDKKFFSQAAFNELMKSGSQLNLENATVTLPRDNSTFKATVSSSLVKDEKNHLIGSAFVIKQHVSAEGAAAEKAAAQKAEAPGVESEIIPFENLVIQNSFFVKKGSMLVKVYLENVLWIQAMDNYVVIQTNDDQFIVHSTMRDIEMKLPPKKFLRVHRSYIIPIEKINVLDEN
ncbi:MAG TPA: response regulator, partial [Bacteroidia bacterium]|nr:response regulator [Bacteroidia bacterium]